MRGTPYGTQPSAPGGCIPFGSSEDVNDFVAKFKAVSAKRPIKLLGHELHAQPKRGAEGRLVNQRLEAVAHRLSELLGTTR
eukprot:15472115-Alexandrium_andersonii.AAC.1